MRAAAVAVTAAVVALGGAVTAPAFVPTATVLGLGGTTQLVDFGRPLPPLDPRMVLGGAHVGPSDTVVPLDYPAAALGMTRSIDIGASRLLDAIDAAPPGGVRVVGLSQGAVTANEAKRRLMARPAAERPAAGDLSFVHVGDPTDPFGGLLTRLGVRTVETPWATLYVTREYDGFADLPDRANLLAWLNAAAGVLYVHPHYGAAVPGDLPAGNVTEWTNGEGGKTTHVLVPTDRLPILQPLRDLGIDERWVSAVERHLKPIVDAGYSRNDRPTPPVPAEVPTPVEVEPVAAEAPEREVDAESADETPGRVRVADRDVDDEPAAKPARADRDDDDERPVRVDRPAADDRDAGSAASSSAGGDDSE